MRRLTKRNWSSDAVLRATPEECNVYCSQLSLRKYLLGELHIALLTERVNWLAVGSINIRSLRDQAIRSTRAKQRINRSVP
jgi:hypothetical protein